MLWIDIYYFECVYCRRHEDASARGGGGKETHYDIIPRFISYTLGSYRKKYVDISVSMMYLGVVEVVVGEERDRVLVEGHVDLSDGVVGGGLRVARGHHGLEPRLEEPEPVAPLHLSSRHTQTLTFPLRLVSGACMLPRTRVLL